MKKMRIGLAAMLLCMLVPVMCLAEAVLRGYTKEEGYQYVSLGSFPQLADGTELPILWRVLSVEDGYAYLLSEYVLFNNRVHPDDKAYIAFGGAFNQTEMFQLLNGPFEGDPLPKEEQDELKAIWRIGRVHIAETCFREEAFTEEEQACLVEDEELGMIFLADAADIKNAAYGFTSDKSRMGYGTEYALANGLFQYMNGSSPYWTRSQSSTKAYGTRCTKENGNLGYIRCVVMNEGCRPAIRLKLDALDQFEGSGLMGDPIRLAR